MRFCYSAEEQEVQTLRTRNYAEMYFRGKYDSRLTGHRNHEKGDVKINANAEPGRFDK